MGIRDSLAARARLLGAIRRFFDAEGFLEVETPALVQAPAPEVWVDAISAEGDLWLACSPELQMKRLLAAGSGPIYQIGRSYRRGERGPLHRPEFTMLEWYRPNADYRAAMDDAVRLLKACAGGAESIRFRSETIALPAALDGAERLTVREAFERWTGAPPPADPDAFTLVLAEQVEPRLGHGRPTILHDYPLAQASLARRSPHDPAVGERFELYVAGIEIANGFGELCDPDEQRARFLAWNDERAARGKPRYPIDEAFLADLGRLGQAAGVAWGVDRTLLLLTDAPDIATVMPTWD